LKPALEDTELLEFTRLRAEADCSLVYSLGEGNYILVYYLIKNFLFITPILIALEVSKSYL
jgi:hypothetical protein